MCYVLRKNNSRSIINNSRDLLNVIAKREGDIDFLFDEIKKLKSAKGSYEKPSNLITVAKEGGDYDSIQDAINAATPTADERTTILLYPGLYTEQVTLKDYVSVVGIDRYTSRVQFSGNNNGTIIMASNSSLCNLIVEQTTVATEWAIVSTDQSRVHIRNVDILGEAANGDISQGIQITGDTWTTVFIEHCVIDIHSLVGNGIYASGNAAAPQNCDMHINDVFIDSYQATAGGGLRIIDLFAPRLKFSVLRTSAAGYDISVEDSSANTTDLLVEGTTCEFGTSSVEIDAGATVISKHSVFDTVAGAGTHTRYANAIVAPYSLH